MPRSRGPARAGARRGAPVRRGPPVAALVRATAALVALVGWAVLVWTAIGQGRSARGGDGQAWWWLAGASLGAAACLFGCLLLATSALRRTGVLTSARAPRH